MRMNYYAIKIVDSGEIRWAGPVSGPRAASKETFGSIYDRNEAMYLDFGKRKPIRLSLKKLQEMYNIKENWKFIPKDGD